MASFRVEELVGLRVLVPKKPKTTKDGRVVERASKLGRVHMAVFTPDGRSVAGLLVKRPDVVGMVKREDAFLALDSFKVGEKTLTVSRPQDGLGDEALRRLGLYDAWDRCILWAGMDARTADGKPLGYVSDAEFDRETGRVLRFFTTDGGVSQALIGSFQISPQMVVGYRDGFMIVDPKGQRIELDGGLAGAAGEGYARAKAGAAEMGKKVGAAASQAVDKGSFALGRALGKAKRAIADATAEEDAPSPVPPAPAEAVRVEKPVEGLPQEASSAAAKRPAPKTYAPAASGAEKRPAGKQASKPAAKSAAKTRSAGDKVARAAGKQLGSLGKMFGSFKDEFDKASK